jgi:hypothetical protein
VEPLSNLLSLEMNDGETDADAEVTSILMGQIENIGSLSRGEINSLLGDLALASEQSEWARVGIVVAIEEQASRGFENPVSKWPEESGILYIPDDGPQEVGSISSADPNGNCFMGCILSGILGKEVRSIHYARLLDVPNIVSTLYSHCTLTHSHYTHYSG